MDDSRLTLEALIKSCVGKNCNLGITEENFPPSGESAPLECLSEFHFNREMTISKVAAEFETSPLRVATLREMLIYGIAHPEVGISHPLAALGSSLEDSWGNPSIPILGRSHSTRYLYLAWHGMPSIFTSDYRFLAANK